MDQRPLRLGPEPLPHDIEALATLDGDLVVVGSHSRSKECASRPKRQRIGRFSRTPAGTLRLVKLLDGVGLEAKLASREACLAGLFVAPAPVHAPDACAALVAAQSTALAGGPCEALNIEGAVAAGTPARLWLGLRSPLAAGNALLLRLVPGLSELRFDGVALLPLGGAGIRELAADGVTLRVVGGPTSDGPGAHSLFALPLEALQPGATLAPTTGVALPPSSEGLIPSGVTAVVLTDGDRGPHRGSCRIPSTQLTVTSTVP